VVCVIVRIEDISDPEPLGRGYLQVDVDVPARIHDDGVPVITDYV
jgi:hypothetical protein